MTKVLFDHQKFSTQKFGGISKYFATLMDYLEMDQDFDYESGVLYSGNEYLNQKNNKLLEWFFSRNFLNKKIQYALNQKHDIGLLKKNDFDLFHPTYYDPYFIPFLKKPLVVTIHDMTYERLPEYFWGEDKLTMQKRLNIERADAVIAISETTKKDLLELYPNLDESKVEVIYHGIDTQSELQVKEVAGLPPEYLLFVGDRSGYKNFYIALEAFKQVALLKPDLKFVLVGGGPLVLAEKEAFYRLKLDQKIIHLEVTDLELNYIYSRAELFIYPSLYEGFGLPILEAFKAGCPVLLSDIECFKEVAADAAEFFEARSRESLISQILKVLNDTTLAAHLIKKGKERIKYFEIEKCVQQTFNLYKKLKA